MSLISFIKNADVKDRFRQEFNKPAFSVTKDMVAPPLTTHYGTVGTAFDYLLRFHIQHLNPHTIDKGYWVAETAVDMLVMDEGLHAKGKKIVSQARAHLNQYLKKGKMSDELIESALLLATLDPIYRANAGHEMIGIIDKNDIQDLKNLISAVDSKIFTANKLCLVNPTFGSASALVGGADADLVIDDTIIDIKTVKNLSLDSNAFNQLLGYYVLHQIGGVGAVNPKPNISKVSIYFSRYGYFHVMQLDRIINQKTFPQFIKWFEQRAKEEF